MRFFYFVPIAAVGLLFPMPLSWAAGSDHGRQLPASSSSLESGDYTWHPESSSDGPVVIIASLSDQVLYVFRNGVRIGRSTISSGKPGHGTPTGVYTILQKNVKHTSTIFKGAPMPYMERLTWSGVAMHAGNLPGYPASHGCVRLPLDFARKLYAVTTNGTTVIVTDHRSRSDSSKFPSILFNASTEATPPKGITFIDPSKATNGPISIIVSSADAEIYVYRNGVEIGRSPLGGLHGLTGLYVYSALSRTDASGQRDWFCTASIVGYAPKIKELKKLITVDPQFRAQIRALVSTGTTLVLTDAPVGTRSIVHSQFDILTSLDPHYGSGG